MQRIICIGLLLVVSLFASAQEQDTVVFRGSIPDELLMPKRDEAPRYPVDTVIGELGQGSASDAAYSFAKSIAEGLFSGAMAHSGLSTIKASLRESYLASLDKIDLRGYRLGGGRKEPDGAFSFMIRFIGKEQGITGELFIRFVTEKPAQAEEIKEVPVVLSEDTDPGDDLSENDLSEGNLSGDNLLSDEPPAEEKIVKTNSPGKWVFDELLLEEAKNLEDEQKDSLRRSDFSPYERFF